MVTNTSSDRPRSGLKARKWLVVGALALGVAAVVGVVLAVMNRRPPPDPEPQAFVSPYRNTRPGVNYVGDAACFDCHKNRSHTYHAQRMGRSFASVKEMPPLEDFDPKATTVEAPGLLLSVRKQDGRLFHKVTYRDPEGKPIPGLEIEAEVRYALGSGAQGRSYIVERDGYLFHSPISWFTKPHAWNLSPDEKAAKHPSRVHFNVPIEASCLFCHANQVHSDPDTLNHFKEPIFEGHAIGCERCHGPGELHVQRQRAREKYEGGDDTIVNPEKLEPVLREAVCQQCHLHGEVRVVRRGRSVFDYRPGLPFHEFASVFVRAPEEVKEDEFDSVSQLEQLPESRCFQKSGGQLGCVSCHDPHVRLRPERRVGFYRARCLTCHQDEHPCTAAPALREQTGDSCIDCHMPRRVVRDIAHAAATDHRIPRLLDRPPPRPRPQLRPGGIPLLHFQRDLLSPADPETDRDLGLAMVEWAKVNADPAFRKKISDRALPLLRAAVQRVPDDADAWQGLGYALWQVGRRDEALEALEQALRHSPRREKTLRLAAGIAAELGRTDVAIGYDLRLLEVDPFEPNILEHLADQHARRKEWAQARDACRKALRLHPAHLAARTLLVECLAREGNRDEARAELDRLMALNPPGRDGLRHRLEGLMR
jgi:Flp pilus assembly protein TadD